MDKVGNFLLTNAWEPWNKLKMAVRWWQVDSTAKTRDVFLICIAAVYMFAFGSIYTQIPGKMEAKVCIYCSN